MSREALTMALEALENAKPILIGLQTIGIKAGATSQAMRINEQFIQDLAITAIKEVLAQQEHPEQMARLGWQYLECPACGSEGARAFPKPEQEPRVDYKAAYYSLLEKYDRGAQPEQNLTCKSTQARLATAWGYVRAQPEQWTPEDMAYRPGGIPQDVPQTPQEHSSNEQFTPDWDEKAVLVEEMQRMAKQVADMKSEQEPWLLESTQTLAKTLAREFYPEVTQWECLNYLAGVISQIDHMTTGLMRKTEQEPVAVVTGQYDFPMMQWRSVKHQMSTTIGSLLYTSPPQRQPLTDEQIVDIADDYKSQYSHCGQTYDEFDYKGFARAIEAAHGIGDKT